MTTETTKTTKRLIEMVAVKVDNHEHGTITTSWEVSVIVQGDRQGEELGFMTELRMATVGAAHAMIKAYEGHTHFDVAGMFCFGRVDNMDDEMDEEEDDAERRAVFRAEVMA